MLDCNYTKGKNPEDEQGVIVAAKLSIHTEKFLAGINTKFYPDRLDSGAPGKFHARAGRKFDKVFHQNIYGSGSIYVFIDRITGDIIKPSSIKAPQRDPETSELAIRYNIATEEGYAEAIRFADQSGGFLYDNFVKSIPSFLQDV